MVLLFTKIDIKAQNFSTFNVFNYVDLLVEKLKSGVDNPILTL